MIRLALFFIATLLCTTLLCASSNYILMRDTSFSKENDSLKLSDIEGITIIGSMVKSMTGSGQYIGSAKLSMLNQTNVNHVLRSIAGINIRDEEGFGLRPNIGLRGSSVNRSAKVTIMEDGILIAPATYADPSAYYFPTFARMQGIEVLKGSSQIKYGPYTIGGAINLISTAIPKSFQGFAQLSYGSFGTNQQRIWFGDSHKNIDYVFEVSRLASDGFKKLDTGGKTGFNRRDIMGKLRWHTDENASIHQSVTLKLVQSSEAGNESYLGLTYEDFKSNPLRRYAATQKDLLQMNHDHLSLSHHIIPFKNLSISTTVYRSNTFRDWARVNTIGGQNLNNILGNPASNQDAYNIMVGQKDGNVDFQSAARTYYAQGLQSNIMLSFETGKINHQFHFGMRLHDDEADRYATRSVYDMRAGKMILSNAGVTGNQENQIRKASSLALYTSYDLQIGGLKVSPGIRYESIKFNFQNFGNVDSDRLGSLLKAATNNLDIFLPGIGANYAINTQQNIFFGIHKGFSPPGMPSTSSTMGQAQAETAINYELGYRYHKHNVSIQMVGFFNSYNNILGSDNISGGGAGTGDVFNAGNAKIRGLELNVDLDLYASKGESDQIKIPFSVTYTYTYAQFQETFVNAGGDWGNSLINSGDAIPFITPHLLTASLAYENQRFNVSLSARYVGETRTKPGQNVTVTPNDNIAYTDVNAIAGFFMMDLSANYTFNKTLTTFTTVNNLTNNKSIVSNLPNGYRPNMPLNINIGIKLAF